MPRLRSLKLVNVWLGHDAGRVDAPLLQHLDLERCDLTSGFITELAATSLPMLQTLVLDQRPWSAGPAFNSARLEDLQALFSGRTMPRLQRLYLRGMASADELISLLMDWPRSRSLQLLDLSRNPLTSVGVQVILNNAERFRNLRELVIDPLRLEPGELEALRRVCKRVSAGGWSARTR